MAGMTFDGHQYLFDSNTLFDSTGEALAYYEPPTAYTEYCYLIDASTREVVHSWHENEPPGLRDIIGIMANG